MAGVYGKTIAGSGLTVSVDSTGKLGTTVSSLRYKEDVVDMGADSAALMKLRPVSFYYKPEFDSTRIRQYGLIAEQVATVAPDLVVYGENGEPETVRYHFVNAMLLNEVQRQERALDELRREIRELKEALEAFRRPSR